MRSVFFSTLAGLLILSVTSCTQESTCVPDCGTRVCGLDPECGVSCGECSSMETCTNDGQCECTFIECNDECCSEPQVCFSNACCTPDCQSKQCGDDGCGGECGTCGTNQTCGTAGQCDCTYVGCADVCCSDGEVCHNNSCCLPDCQDRECGEDGCGDMCGTCGVNETCNASGICDCTYTECQGTCCADGQVCLNDACCTPDCINKECGDDGCGDVCGTCGVDEACNSSFICVVVECMDHTECLPEQYCLEYQCLSDECSTDADCLPEEECAPEGFCRERPPVPCSVDSDCRPDELCLDGECKFPPDCTEDADCPTDTVCLVGRCDRPCTVDSDCGSFGYVCMNGHCFQQCIQDDNCREPGTICENNICVPAECETDQDCMGQNTRCRNGRCETYTPCTTDADCEANYECLNNICEELPICAVDDDCAQDCQSSACICKDGHCHEVAICSTEADCTAEEDCVGGICVPHLCRGHDDCQAGEICVDGACMQGGNPALVYEVIILTPGGPIRSGQQNQLEAIALDQNGQSVPGIGFDWYSDAATSVSVDADGVATGESVAGDADITATAQGTAPPVISFPVTFTNVLDPSANTVRVTVVSAIDRTPVVGATVVLDDGTTQETGTTDATGSVELADPGDVADIHVFSADHDYVSVLGTISKDLLVPLPDRSDLTKAGGFSGQMTCVGDEAVSMGLAGASIAGNLVDLNPARLLGQVFNVTVNMGGYAFDLPLPAQMVMMATFQGMTIPVKEVYYVTGQRGLRAAWALGGFVDLSVLTDLIQSGDINDALVELLPHFSLFLHGLVPVFDVFPQDLVVDANDLDGDQDITEMRPDWGGTLPDLDLAPTRSQDIYLNVTPPNTPTHGGQPIATIVYVSGALPSLGFTPLGLTSDQATGGVADPMTMKMAPAYGGLEVGEYAVLVMAVPPAVNNQMPTDVATVLYVDQNLPTNISFDYGFLAFPEDAVFTAASRELTATAVAGASMYRSTIQAPEGRWIVYLSGTGTLTYTLPAVPGGMDDLGTGNVITFDPITLSGGITFEDLVTFNGEDIVQLNKLMTACTRYQL